MEKMAIMTRHVARLVVGGLALCMAVPSAVQAQASLTGVVTDASGAVLPGVTVEAASPALIEQVRSAASDGTGQYRIEQLRPGGYVVTFTLAGFSVVIVDGIELQGDGVFTVNAELTVGGLEETLTVTGEAPIVDVQSVRVQRVIGDEVIAALPTGRTMLTVATLMPGVTLNRQAGSDVGGTNQLSLTVSMTIHGSLANDMRVLYDGLSYGNHTASGQFSNITPDMGATREVVVNTAAGSAERAFGGLEMNIVPKDGGNNFSGTFFYTGTSGGLQGNNFTDELKSQGVRTPNELDTVYSIDAGVGGPIKEDKLWFFVAGQAHRNSEVVAGKFWNKNYDQPDNWMYEADLTRPSVYSAVANGMSTRLTWQAAQNQKVTLYVDHQEKRQHFGINAGGAQSRSHEAASHFPFPQLETWQLTWVSPVSNRMLVDLRTMQRFESYESTPLPRPGIDDIRRAMMPVWDQGLGWGYRGPGSYAGRSGPWWSDYGRLRQVVGSVSYVTGAHAFKAGFDNRWNQRERPDMQNDRQMHFRFNNGVPNQLSQRGRPRTFANLENGTDGGLYAQDRWTVGNLTVNAGVRMDWTTMMFPEMHMGPSLYLPNQDVTTPKTDWISFKDITPRFGVAYDLFGTGKTAIKVGVNKYVVALGLQGIYGDQATPMQRRAIIITRAWDDANGNFEPDCVLADPFANGECGTMSNTDFGGEVPTTIYDPATLKGWDSRPNNWEFTVALQHEILPRLSVDVGFFRRTYGNVTLFDNRAVSAADYSEYSITAPTDGRLGSVSGQTIGDLWNLNPDKVGKVDRYFTHASNYGKLTDSWSGVDATMNWTLAGGGLIQGGVSTGLQKMNSCDVVGKLDNPSKRFCDRDVQRPYGYGFNKIAGRQTQVKFQAVYPIPVIDVQISGVFSSVPGAQLAANHVVSNTAIEPSLGRPLSGGASVAVVNLVKPGDVFGTRQNRVDLRIAKPLRFGGSTMSLQMDIFNLLNANTVTTFNNSFSVWQQPLAIVLARFIKLGVQFDF